MKDIAYLFYNQVLVGEPAKRMVAIAINNSFKILEEIFNGNQCPVVTGIDNRTDDNAQKTKNIIPLRNSCTT